MGGLSLSTKQDWRLSLFQSFVKLCAVASDKEAKEGASQVLIFGKGIPELLKEIVASLFLIVTLLLNTLP